MPPAGAAPDVQPCVVSARVALALLWLAESVHADCVSSTTGNVALISATVHCVFRADVVARTRATSEGVMKDAELPKLLRTYEPTEATQLSSCFIGIMTSEYVRPLFSPVRPCRMV